MSFPYDGTYETVSSFYAECSEADCSFAMEEHGCERDGDNDLTEACRKHSSETGHEVIVSAGFSICRNDEENG